MITQEFGKDIASSAGFAHEGFEVPQVGISADGSAYTLGSDQAAGADAMADLINNTIGQTIGENNPDASNVDLATAVLNEFKENGMWTVTETETGYSVTRTTLTHEQYDQALQNLQNLQENGMNKKEEKKEEE